MGLSSALLSTKRTINWLSEFNLYLDKSLPDQVPYVSMLLSSKILNSEENFYYLFILDAEWYI